MDVMVHTTRPTCTQYYTAAVGFSIISIYSIYSINIIPLSNLVL